MAVLQVDQSAQANPPGELHRILRMEVPVIVKLADRKLLLSEVMRLGIGAIIEFSKRNDEPLELLINNKTIAQGETVKVGENFGLRITQIGDIRNTIQSLTESKMSKATLAELTQRVVRHRDDRQWAQFHNAKELAISLTVESGELLALMQWKTGEALEQSLQAKRADVRDEMADCLHSLLLLADHLKVDLAEALQEKLVKDALKYPVEKSRGRAEKYTDL